MNVLAHGEALHGESTFDRLIDSLSRVQDLQSLVHEVCRFLDGQFAVLLERPASSDPTRRMVACYPPAIAAWAGEHLAELRDWCEFWAPPENARGFSLESDIEIGGKKLRDLLLAWGSSPETGAPVREVLVALPPGSDRRYNSFDCAGAAALLRHWEGIYERLRADFYSEIVDRTILPGESWQSFVERSRFSGNSDDRERLPLLGPSLALWSIYRGRSGDSCEQATTWLETQSKPEAWQDFRVGVQFADSRCQFSPALATIAESWFRGGDSDLQRAAVAMLELGWRRLHAGLASREAHLDLEYVRDALDSLMRLTAVLLGELLAKSGGAVARGSLRCFLLARVCLSKRLRRDYLWSGPDEGTRVPRRVAEAFALSLARLVLAALAEIQGKVGLSSSPRAVSALEELDSLLAVVDRFAHVELGVDEILNVRHSLARGFRAEIVHHLDHNRYRDHLLHVVDVFLLGLAILECRVRWSQPEALSMAAEFALIRQATPVASGCPSGEANILREWTVASLLHDIGYQLPWPEDVPGVDRMFKGFLAMTEGASDVEELGGGGRREVLEAILKKAEDLKPAWTQEFFDQEKGWHSDHGVISSLKVLHALQYRDGPKATLEQRKETLKSHEQALHAMSRHNMMHVGVRLREYPLSCLLRLCDEVQEWDRPRVEVEHVVKQLYLAIGGSSAEVEGRIAVSSVQSNLVFRLHPTGDGAGWPLLVVETEDSSPRFEFRLEYLNPLVAGIDPTITAFAKSFNLQQIDIGESIGTLPSFSWQVEMRFPRPPEYGELLESDFLGLVSERFRELPVCRQVRRDTARAPGLSVVLEEADRYGDDVLSIVVSGRSGAEHRHGWLFRDPSLYFERIAEFRRQVLSQAL